MLSLRLALSCSDSEISVFHLARFRGPFRNSIPNDRQGPLRVFSDPVASLISPTTVLTTALFTHLSPICELLRLLWQHIVGKYPTFTTERFHPGNEVKLIIGHCLNYFLCSPPLITLIMFQVFLLQFAFLRVLTKQALLLRKKSPAGSASIANTEREPIKQIRWRPPLSCRESPPIQRGGWSHVTLPWHRLGRSAWRETD